LYPYINLHSKRGIEINYEDNFSVLNKDVIFHSYVDYIFIGNVTLINEA